MAAILFEQRYKMDDEEGRIATITFRDNRFFECSHNIEKPYTLDDWKFLKQVVSEIDRMALSYEGGNEKKN